MQSQQREKKLEQKDQQRTSELGHEKQQTEQNRQELEKQHTIKNRLFENISHDLRTPVSLMKGPLTYLIEHTDVTEKQKHWLEVAIDNTNRIQRRVDQILNLTKLDQERFNIKEEKITLKPFIKKLEDAFSSRAVDKNITFRCRLQEIEDIGTVEIDPNALDDILGNLISNAIKFTPEGGEVSLTVSLDDSDAPSTHLKFKVKDTGIGIAPDQQQQIFERFFQAKQTTKTRENGGLGIGLALTSQLVDLMGGTIEVQSTPGQGSTFILKLPVRIIKEQENDKLTVSDSQLKAEDNTETNINIKQMKPAPNGNSWNARILVVEDNRQMREYITTLLRPYADVMEAKSSTHALDKLEHAECHLIISDIMMTGGGGFELLEKVRSKSDQDGQEATGRIPFIFVTALAGESHKMKGLKFGIDDYIEKPFEPDELIYRAKNLIDRYNVIREAVNYQEGNRDNDDEQGYEPEQGSPTNADGTAGEVRMIILNNLSDSDFSVSTLAEHLHISRRHLNRKLQQEVGYNTSQFIKEVRLLEARSLLESGENMSVSEVAHRIGYNTPSYFSTIFKKRFGKSPSKF